MKWVGWLLSDTVIQVREVRAGSEGKYTLSRWVYECACKPA